MAHLYEALSQLRQQWTQESYPCDEFPAISEILQYQFDSETGALRFLRKPQIRALEIYWYLRLVENTPHTIPTIAFVDRSGGHFRKAREDVFLNLPCATAPN